MNTLINFNFEFDTTPSHPQYSRKCPFPFMEDVALLDAAIYMHAFVRIRNLWDDNS
jgi:hypothetical protein